MIAHNATPGLVDRAIKQLTPGDPSLSLSLSLWLKREQKGGTQSPRAATREGHRSRQAARQSRSEARGAGGIFFDNLQNNWEYDFEFIKKVGKYFRDFVKDTLSHLKNEQWNEDEKNIQLVKRSRYAEFNLLHDRGTKFGLETGGNIDAILMSMPPIAKWD